MSANTIAPDRRWRLLVVSILVAPIIDFVEPEERGPPEVSVKEASDWSTPWVAVLCRAVSGLLRSAINGSIGDFELASAQALEF